MDGSSKLLKDAYKLFATKYYLSFLTSIVELVDVSRNAEALRSAKRFYELQLGLLKLIEDTDKIVSDGKREARATNDVEVIMQRKRNKTLSYAFRTIGDGMAWRASGYSRFVIRVLSQSRSPGSANDKAGRKRELEWAGNAVRNGGFVIIHDVTNILRVGDLSLFTKIPDSKPFLSEVKTRKSLATAKDIGEKIDEGKESELSKQEIRLWQAQMMISTRRWYGTNTVAVTDIIPKKIDYLSGAGAIMKQAEKKSVFGRFVAPYMYIDAFDLTVIASSSLEEIVNKLEPYNIPDRNDVLVFHSRFQGLSLATRAHFTGPAIQIHLRPHGGLIYHLNQTDTVE